MFDPPYSPSVPMRKPPSHILAIRLSALGDVAMTLPVLYSVARQYPDLQLTLLTRPFFARLFLNAPPNLRVVSFEADKGLWHNLRSLSKLRPQAIADLHNVLRSWVIDAYFLFRGTRVAMLDKKRHERRLIQAHRIDQAKPFIERYQTIFERLGYPAALSFRSLFAESGIPPLPLKVEPHAIGIAPFARYHTKTYPLEQMKETVARLVEADYTVYLFGGGKREKEVLEQWEQDIPQTISLAGKYRIEEELALLSQMKLVISMDSANQHLASLVGTPVLTLWGGTTPACGFLGYGQSMQNTLCQQLHCQPCSVAGSEHCAIETFDCMHLISPENIVTKVIELTQSSL